MHSNTIETPLSLCQRVSLRQTPLTSFSRNELQLINQSKLTVAGLSVQREFRHCGHVTLRSRAAPGLFLGVARRSRPSLPWPPFSGRPPLCVRRVPAEPRRSTAAFIVSPQGVRSGGAVPNAGRERVTPSFSLSVTGRPSVRSNCGGSSARVRVFPCPGRAGRRLESQGWSFRFGRGPAGCHCWFCWER